MYIKDNDGRLRDKKNTVSPKKEKVFINEYEDTAKKTKLDPYNPSKFRRKINLRDIDFEED